MSFFTKQASAYAAGRPSYPASVLKWAVGLHGSSGLNVLDLGCGSGQATVGLARLPKVRSVVGIELSQQQLDHAKHHPKVRYAVSSASDMPTVKSGSCDVIASFAAAHWFAGNEQSHKEIRRVANTGAVVVFLSYNHSVTGDEAVDAVQAEWLPILQGYWAPEIAFNMAAYEELPFPYEEIADIPDQRPPLESVLHCTLKERLLYIRSWSAVSTYKERNGGKDPVDELEDELKRLWPGDEKKRVVFPLHYKCGRVT